MSISYAGNQTGEYEFANLNVVQELNPGLNPGSQENDQSRSTAPTLPYQVPLDLRKAITTLKLIEPKKMKLIRRAEEEEEEYYDGEFYDEQYQCGFGTSHKISSNQQQTIHTYYQGWLMANFYHGLGILIIFDEKKKIITNQPKQTSFFKGKEIKELNYTDLREFEKNNNYLKISKIYSQKKHYIGGFHNDQRTGIGKYTWEDGTYYLGEFKDDKFNGFGLMKYKNGDQYLGEWKDSKMEGFGEFVWKNGEKYIGFYQNNQKNGFGNYHWRDGVQYFGNFAGNLQNGLAIIKPKDGPNIQTEWEKGKRIIDNQSNN